MGEASGQGESGHIGPTPTPDPNPNPNPNQAPCLEELRARLAVLGITVHQGRSAIGEAHSAILHAYRGSV